MTGGGLQKSFTDEDGLQVHRFFKCTGLRADLAAGQVFPRSSNVVVS